MYLTGCGQEVIDRAVSVKPKKAELVWAYIDVEPMNFNKGYYQVDIHYYFKVTFDAYCGGGRPVCIEGLSVYDKRAVLFGSEGTAKTFSSCYIPSAADVQRSMRSNAPQVSLEVVDPVVLGSKLLEPCDHQCCCGCDVDCLPEAVCCCFDEPLVSNGHRVLTVSLGLFSIIRLSRNVQLLIPAYDFCIPDKECQCGECDDPCELFKKFKFPMNQFFPPREEQDGGCGCGCGK